MPDFWVNFMDTLQSSNAAMFIGVGVVMLLVIGGLSTLSHMYTLNGIKSRTVGDGQHGTARWATTKEIQQTFAHVPFNVKDWRHGKDRPKEQGLVLGSIGKKNAVTALVDSDDIHCLMIGASGVGKTAFFLYWSVRMEQDFQVWCRQDSILPVPQFGVCLCQRHELSGIGHQG